MKKINRTLLILVLGCGIALGTTACKRDSELYNALSASSDGPVPESASESTEHVVNTDDTRIMVDPFEEMKKQASDITPIGSSAVFSDPETLLEHTVKVVSVSYGKSLSEIGVSTNNIEEYLFEKGDIESSGEARQGYKFMVINCEVTRTHGLSEKITADDERNRFAIADACIMNSKFEPCDVFEAGLVQPEETRINGGIYSIRIPETGKTIECKMIFLIKEGEQPAILSSTWFVTKLFSLNT